MGAPLSAHRLPMLVHVVEDLTALLRHKHQVLHPDPELTREVHSWLNGEDHPRLGHQLCDCTYIPLLMLCLANKMPQAVGEVLTIARRSDMFPGRDVQLPQGDTGTDHSLRDLIGTADQVMDGRVFGVRSLAEEGAGHIGAVPVFPAAHIDDNAVSRLQAGLVRLMMGVGGVGAE